VRRHIQRWLPILFVVSIVLIVWQKREQLSLLFSDADSVRTWIMQFGSLGPIVIIVLNAVQIIIAPLPSYPIQLAAGYLLGIWGGFLCSIMGMLIGGTVAAALARHYGRPLVQRIMGTERFAHWEHVIHADSVILWILLMLMPVGEAPYFMAGLASIPIWKIMAIALFVRAPMTLIVVAAGSNTLPIPLLVGLFVALYVIALVAYRYHSSIEQYLHDRLQARGKPRNNQ